MCRNAQGGLLVSHHCARAVLHDEQWSEQVAVELAIGVVGHVNLETCVSVVDNAVNGVGGFDNHRKVHGHNSRSCCYGNAAGAWNLAAAHAAVMERKLSGLGASILWCEVEGHHFAAMGRNLGLDHCGVLAVLVNLLVAHIEIELAREAVVAIVLNSDMALLSRAHPVVASELKVGGGEVVEWVVDQCCRVATHVHLNVVTVALKHWNPLAGALHLAHRHNFIGAVRDVLAKVVILRAVAVGPLVGNRDSA